MRRQDDGVGREDTAIGGDLAGVGVDGEGAGVPEHRSAGVLDGPGEAEAVVAGMELRLVVEADRGPHLIRQIVFYRNRG